MYFQIGKIESNSARDAYQFGEDLYYLLQLKSTHFQSETIPKRIKKGAECSKVFFIKRKVIHHIKRLTPFQTDVYILQY